MQKTISRQTYLTALGLFTLAAMYERKTTECTIELERLLGVSDGELSGSHFADAVYNDGSLDEALRRADYKVEDN